MSFVDIVPTAGRLTQSFTSLPALPSPRAMAEALERRRAALAFGGAALALAGLAIFAPRADIALQSWKVAQVSQSLQRQADLAALVVGRAPPVDVDMTLALLDHDPRVRAEMALYEAALLRPSVGAATLGRLKGENGLASRNIEQLVQTGLAILSAPEPAKISVRARPSLGSRRRAAPPGYIDAVLSDAARHVGVDLDYLRRTAGRESGFNAYAAARRSTARGLFQFIESTWLLSVAKWGARHGLANEAALVTIDSAGRPHVADRDQKQRILALRYDPILASRLAAESASENRALLIGAFGREPNRAELYAAHLLGPAGATRLITMAYTRPNYPAVALFPAAAASNPRLFFNRGVARSCSELLFGLH